jgi:hypothetical protein
VCVCVSLKRGVEGSLAVNNVGFRNQKVAEKTW